MRIVGGTAKGRKLFAPEGLDTRPTADRVRESVFNILSTRVPDARVLDLFSGSGAMALEALSRGAAFAALVDASRAAFGVIRRNVDLVGWNDRCLLVNRDWRAALERLSGDAFSLVFLDPPYRMTEVYGEAATALWGRGLLTEDAILVMERRTGVPIPIPEGFEIFDERKYGEATVAFVRRTL